MKFITKEELIALIKKMPGDNVVIPSGGFLNRQTVNMISIDDISRLFEEYGDDCFRDYGYNEPWAMTKFNEARGNVLLPDLSEVICTNK